MEQVQIWRRSYDVCPPPMEPSHPYYEQIAVLQAMQHNLTKEIIPKTESLKDLIEQRTVPFWKATVEKDILAGETVLCVAHGTSLRGIVKHIEQISDEDICKIDLPNGIPLVYRSTLQLVSRCYCKYLCRLDSCLQLLESPKYLADEETVEKALQKVSRITPKH